MAAEEETYVGEVGSMDVNDPRADFAPMLSEDRGNHDVALLFDPRHIHDADLKHFLRTALTLAGPAFEGAWARYGTVAAEWVSDEARTCAEHVTLAKPIDVLNGAAKLVVAELGDIALGELSAGLQRLTGHDAFVGAVTLVGASEFRTQLSSNLAWVD